jgi:flagellar biosynthetic protein FliQ
LTPETVITIANQALKVTLMLGAPILISALFLGMMVAVFQAVTQINEVTLTFIPKVIGITIALVVAAPWMLRVIMSFTINLFDQIPNYIK